MSVIDVSRHDPPIDFLLDAVRGEQDCFYCGEALTSPAIHWMGTGFNLIVHPGCCVELVIRLLRDVYQIENESRIKVTARTLPELRRRLMAEEAR